MNTHNPQLWFRALEFKTNKNLDIDGLKEYLENEISPMEVKIEEVEVVDENNNLLAVEITVYVNYQPGCMHPDRIIDKLHNALYSYSIAIEVDVYGVRLGSERDAVLSILDQDECEVVDEYIIFEDEEIVRVYQGKISKLRAKVSIRLNHIEV